MAAYDYRCRACDTLFEVRRDMVDDRDDVRCPQGHADVARVWSAVAVTGLAPMSGSAVSSLASSGGGGGCCGGACGCG